MRKKDSNPYPGCISSKSSHEPTRLGFNLESEGPLLVLGEDFDLARFLCIPREFVVFVYTIDMALFWAGESPLDQTRREL